MLTVKSLIVSKLLLLLVISSFLKVEAQSSALKIDTIPENTLKKDCDGKMFTRVEKIASLKIPLENFQDTLAELFKKEDVIFLSKKATYLFFLTNQNEIFHFQNLSGQVKNEEKLKKIILSLSHLWNTATQNGYKVCAYTRLEIISINEKLQVRIFQ